MTVFLEDFCQLIVVHTHDTTVDSEDKLWLRTRFYSENENSNWGWDFQKPVICLY